MDHSHGHRPLLHIVEATSCVSVYDPATHPEPLFAHALLLKRHRNHRKARPPFIDHLAQKTDELSFLPPVLIDPTVDVLHPPKPRKLPTADHSPHLVVAVLSGNRIALW